MENNFASIVVPVLITGIILFFIFGLTLFLKRFLKKDSPKNPKENEITEEKLQKAFLEDLIYGRDQNNYG